jgi:hypothetical protein
MTFLFCASPLVLFALSVPSTDALGIVSLFLCFFANVPVPIDFLCSTTFLVFAIGLLDLCAVAASAHSFPFVPFFPSIGTFH